MLKNDIVFCLEEVGEFATINDANKNIILLEQTFSLLDPWQVSLLQYLIKNDYHLKIVAGYE